MFFFFVCSSIWQGRHWLPHDCSHTGTHSLGVQHWEFGWFGVQVRIEWLTFDSPTDRRSLDNNSHVARAATAMWCESVLGADSEWMEKHKMSVFEDTCVHVLHQPTANIVPLNRNHKHSQSSTKSLLCLNQTLTLTAGDRKRIFVFAHLSSEELHVRKILCVLMGT